MNGKVLSCTVYFPPDVTYENDSKQHIEHSTIRFRIEHPFGIIFLCGGFNKLALDDLVLDSGLHDMFTEPTHDSNRLDKFLCSDNIYFSSVSRFTSTVKTDNMGLIACHGDEVAKFEIAYFCDQRSSNKQLFNYLLETHDLISFRTWYNPNDILDAINEYVTRFRQGSCLLKRNVLCTDDPPFKTPVNKYLTRKHITRPNCALYRSLILCLYFPGFQRQLFIYVPKCKWIPPTKCQWIPRTNSCNVNFVGTFILLRIPQQANLASCSGFRNCK